MAGSIHKKQKQKQRKLRQRRANQQKKLSRAASIQVPEPPAKVARKMEQIEALLKDGNQRGILLLESLSESHPKIAAVAQFQFDIFQQLEDHERTCGAAKRFLKCVPHNPDAMIGYAQASLFCFRASLALIQYRKFLDRWPNHEFANKMREAVKICESESRKRVKVANDTGGLELAFDEGGLEFYARHEESLEQLTANNIPEAIAILEQNIKQQPQFMSSRNNLTICHFYNGNFEDAVSNAREACELSPENRFAEANLIKVEFLTGNPEMAYELADAAMADPPTEQDAFTALGEALSYLGRDEDLLALSQTLKQVIPIDDDKKAELLHYFAFANFRLGDKEKAEQQWNESLAIHSRQPYALANLQDIESNAGHAAWGQPFGKWLPYAFVREMAARCKDDNAPITVALASDNPVIASVIPAMLDRGDPEAREFALNFAIADSTPPMLAALKDFAFSTRGPDAMRHQAMTTLKEKSIIDLGPHRFFSRGNWTEIKLFGFEITSEPDVVEPWRSELLEKGYWAMYIGDLASAETAFQAVLDRDPTCRSARFNLAGVWQRRGQGDEIARSELEVRKIHEEHPDYTFAALSVAIFEAENGEFLHANELIADSMTKQKLHFSEAMMLFSTQVQVALMQDKLEDAESSWNMMCRIAADDDPRVAQLRQRIDMHRLTKTDGKGLIDTMRNWK